MNESSPEPITAQPLPLPAFKDRSTGLTVFGVLTILLGCLAALAALLMVGAVVSAPKSNMPPPPSSMVSVVFIYIGLAVALIWLGIGSIMARRWARALLLIFSWVWLGMGICLTISAGFLMPKTFANLPAHAANGQPALPPGAFTGVMIFMLLFFGVFFVLMPGIWTFFYKSGHVKATCEARDPVIRWTDACPLPVLGLCLWLLVSAPMMLSMSFWAHGIFPFFGMFLSGVPGSLMYVATAVLWVYCACLLYKLEMRGWWLTLIALMAYLVSSGMTFARHDVVEMYQRMGYPQAQIDQIQKMELMTGNYMEWTTLAFMVPYLGYLLFIKQYLRRKV